MAKNTHPQEAATGTSDSYSEHELSDPNPPWKIQRAMLGGEPLSAGDNSTPSSENAPKSSESTTPDHPKPAQTTDSPSSPTRGTDSDARTTGGHGRKTTRRQSAKKTDPEPDQDDETDIFDDPDSFL